MAKQSPAAENDPSSEARYGAADGVSRPLLSVVIPVYNGVPYLPQLIESLLAQQRVPDEVIFVDDGSTDGSSEMIERLGAALVGLRVVGQKNRGAAVARNIGMRHATGRYLAFLDADDMVDARMYGTLVGLAESERLDIAMCNAWNFHEGRKPDTLVYRDVPDTGVITGEAWFQQRWLSGYLPHYCWIDVYRRSFIDRYGFVFPPADPHEDVVWMTETLLAARRFHFIPQPLHWYRKKKTLDVPTAALAPQGTFRRHRVIEASIYNARALSEIADRETLQPLTRKLMRREFVNGGSHVVRQIRRLSDPAQKAYYLKRIRQERFFRILWRNAAGLSQYWRVFRYHLLAYISAMVVFLKAGS
ncbi:MAG TPA: glycosyltransferase [Burkholderiales bacterium]|nr:glycosyltransferase [Burkholderiales bacterium]